MDLPFKRLRSEGALPSAQHSGDAGLDLRAAIDTTVKPGERVMVPTGVAVAIPDGHAGLVLPRSGLATARGLTLSNSPGLIDAGYRGEVICSVVNLDRDEPVEIRAGDRIAQLVVVAIPSVAPTWAEDLPESGRGEGVRDQHHRESIGIDVDKRQAHAVDRDRALFDHQGRPFGGEAEGEEFPFSLGPAFDECGLRIPSSAPGQILRGL